MYHVAKAVGFAISVLLQGNPVNFWFPKKKIDKNKRVEQKYT